MKNPKIETGTSEELPEGHVVSEEVAVTDVKAFVEQFKFRKLAEEVVLKDYPEVVLGVQKGILTFTDGIPVLKLSSPVKDTDGEIALDVLTFKTRLRPSDNVQISKNLDLKAQAFLYLNKCMAFLISQPVAMLDKLEPLDLKIVEQLSTLFT